MVNMKSYKAIIALISFLVLSEVALAGSKKPADTNGTIGNMPMPKLLGDDLKYSMPAFLWRNTQFMRFRLNREEKIMHQSAVFFMLNDVPNGKIVSWYSKKRLANGKVRVIHSYPISGGYCRTYQAYIKLNGKERHMTNNACKYIGADQTWVFYK